MIGFPQKGAAPSSKTSWLSVSYVISLLVCIVPFTGLSKSLLNSRYVRFTAEAGGLSPRPVRMSKTCASPTETPIGFAVVVLSAFALLFVEGVVGSGVVLSVGAVVGRKRSDAERTWNHMTNSASPKYSTSDASTVRLTFQDGVELPFSGIEFDHGVKMGRKWTHLVDDWEEYIRQKEDQKIVIGKVGTDDHNFTKEASHSFSEKYQLRNYAKLKAWERSAKEEYGDDLTAVMLTLSASSRDPKNKSLWSAPLDHLNDLKEGWKGAYRELNRLFGSSEKYSYVRILEPHKSGYAHMHIGILTAEDVVAEDFESVVDAHTRRCSRASAEAHEVIPQQEQDRRRLVKKVLKRNNRWDALENSEQDELNELGCVSVVSDDADRETSLAAYIGSYIGKELSTASASSRVSKDSTGKYDRLDVDRSVDNPFLDSEEYVKRFYSLMWVSGTRRFSPSRRANVLIEQDDCYNADGSDEENDPELKEWELKGIQEGEGDDADFYPVDPDADRSVEKYTTAYNEDWAQVRVADTVDPPSTDMLEWMRSSDYSRSDDLEYYGLGE